MRDAWSVPTARVFQPLLEPARYKAIHGGRGSAKSHFFAQLLIEDCLMAPGDSAGQGMRAVCIREVQKDLAQSSKLLIETKLQQSGIGESEGFKVFRDVIETPGDGIIIFKGMNDYSADSIKSLEGFKRAWWEEAHTATAFSLELLRPTLRHEQSQLWFSWNPRRESDPVDLMFRGDAPPTGSVVVRSNWRDNPWFPSVLEQERQDCMRTNPDQYGHIWEGEYVRVVTGAYFAASLTEARATGRIGRVARDPLMRLRVFCDIGGAGAKADAFAMWVVQFVGREIRVLDYYEAQGQPLATHVQWLQSRGYTKDTADIHLPHDGATSDRIVSASFESAFRGVGYTVQVVPNQGKGAAKQRIEAVRRLFPSMWFNEETCAPGIAALGWYHEKRDEARGLGLGPDHDWSSHGADAFGLAAICYEPPSNKLAPIKYPKLGIV
jgi:phage terminase large subunit